jgi:hypothetical protein
MLKKSQKVIRRKLSQRKCIRSPKLVFATDLIFTFIYTPIQLPIGFDPTSHGGISAYKKTPLLLLSIVREWMRK